MNSKTVTRSIKEEARRLGFDLVGVADARLLLEERQHLTEWLARGFQASMAWMEKDPEKRTDPERVLPGARSVISVAMNYYRPNEHSTDPDRGKVSRYAWGDDYHDVLGERLRLLEQFIGEQCPGSRSRWNVDTGPVSDKAWAARSGVGWLGKHTNILTRTHGSWIFLGTILTTAQLDADVAETDMCGTCTACIDACPTQAIVEPYVLDSNKCLSYLTIEHRGDLPVPFEHDLRGWVFGCDICQDVCPWNRFQRTTNEPRFAVRPESISPSFSDLRSIEQEECARRFKGSAIKRAKAAGLRRNARAAMESFH